MDNAFSIMLTLTQLGLYDEGMLSIQGASCSEVRADPPFDHY
jgi:hypothetical protein